MKGLDGLLCRPRVQSRNGYGFNIMNQLLQGAEVERTLNKLSKLRVIVALVKEECMRANHLLLALWVGGLEQMSMTHQHKLGGLRAGQHDTRTSQDMSFEYFTIPEGQKKKKGSNP